MLRGVQLILQTAFRDPTIMKRFFNRIPILILGHGFYVPDEATAIKTGQRDFVYSESSTPATSNARTRSAIDCTGTRTVTEGATVFRGGTRQTSARHYLRKHKKSCHHCLQYGPATRTEALARLLIHLDAVSRAQRLPRSRVSLLRLGGHYTESLRYSQPSTAFLLAKVQQSLLCEGYLDNQPNVASFVVAQAGVLFGCKHDH